MRSPHKPGHKPSQRLHQKRAHPDLNQGPADLQSAALTTELCWIIDFKALSRLYKSPLSSVLSSSSLFSALSLSSIPLLPRERREEIGRGEGRGEREKERRLSLNGPVGPGAARRGAWGRPPWGPGPPRTGMGSTRTGMGVDPDRYGGRPGPVWGSPFFEKPKMSKNRRKS